MEQNNKPSFIKVDNNVILNIHCIRWVKKMEECLQLCSKPNGCAHNSMETHTVCKITNPVSYNRLHRFFE